MFIVLSSWFILIELVLLISELLTKCKNSKYFLSYHKKYKQVFSLKFQPFLTLKMDVFWCFFTLKIEISSFSHLNVTKQFLGYIEHPYQAVLAILDVIQAWKIHIFIFLGPIFTKIPISQESLSENSCEVLGGRGLKLSRYHPYIILFKI